MSGCVACDIESTILDTYPPGWDWIKHYFNALRDEKAIDQRVPASGPLVWIAFA